MVASMFYPLDGDFGREYFSFDTKQEDDGGILILFRCSFDNDTRRVPAGYCFDRWSMRKI